MDTSSHTIETLFDQLGLSHSAQAIELFIGSHHLPENIPLQNAAFWSAGQAQFLQEAIDLDSDWAEIVDQLDAQLRH